MQVTLCVRSNIIHIPNPSVYFVISDKAWVHRVESERNFYQYFGACIDTCEYIILCDDTGADGERDKVLPGKTFDTICVNDILEFQIIAMTRHIHNLQHKAIHKVQIDRNSNETDNNGMLGPRHLICNNISARLITCVETILQNTIDWLCNVWNIHPGVTLRDADAHNIALIGWLGKILCTKKCYFYIERPRDNKDRCSLMMLTISAQQTPHISPILVWYVAYIAISLALFSHFTELYRSCETVYIANYFVVWIGASTKSPIDRKWVSILWHEYAVVC